jgi:hypothetical protein
LRELDGRLQRGPAVGTEALEAGELRLDGDAGRAGGLDQRRAVGLDGGAGAVRGRAVVGRPRQRLRPQPGGVGVEAEDDLRFARGDELSQAITERRRAASETSDGSKLPTRPDHPR